MVIEVPTFVIINFCCILYQQLDKVSEIQLSFYIDENFVPVEMWISVPSKAGLLDNQINQR